TASLVGSGSFTTVRLSRAAARHPAGGVGGQSAHVQSGLQTPVTHPAALVPSHSSPSSMTSLPQTGGGHVQSPWQRPGQEDASLPSQSSPTSRTPFPQTGGAASVHAGAAKRSCAIRVFHAPLGGMYSLVYQNVP